MIEREFRHPDPEWLADNYFHDPELDAWFQRLQALVVQRRAGRLPPKAPLARRGGHARDVFERKMALGRKDRTPEGVAAMIVGWPVRLTLRGFNRVRRLMRGPAGAPAESALDAKPLEPQPRAAMPMG